MKRYGLSISGDGYDWSEITWFKKKKEADEEEDMYRRVGIYVARFFATPTKSNGLLEK